MEVQTVPQVDYLAFFSTELPKQLAEMAKLRDELQQRQGAMSAVSEANAMREQAAKMLEQAHKDAQAMRQAAQDELRAAEDSRKQAGDLVAGEAKKVGAMLDEVNAKLKVLEQERSDFDLDVKKKTTALDRREKEFASKLATLESQQKALSAERATLEVRIKKFSDAIGAV